MYSEIMQLKRENFSVSIKRSQRDRKIEDSRQRYLWIQSYCEQFEISMDIYQQIVKYTNDNQDDYSSFITCCRLVAFQHSEFSDILQHIVDGLLDNFYGDHQAQVLGLITYKGFQHSQQYCKFLMGISYFKTFMIEKAATKNIYLILLINCITTGQKYLSMYFRPMDLIKIIDKPFCTEFTLKQFYGMILFISKNELFKQQLGQKLINHVLSEELILNLPLIKIVSRLTRICSANIDALIQNERTVIFLTHYLSNQQYVTTNISDTLKALKILLRILERDEDSKLQSRDALSQYLDIYLLHENQKIRDLSYICQDHLLNE